MTFIAPLLFFWKDHVVFLYQRFEFPVSTNWMKNYVRGEGREKNRCRESCYQFQASHILNPRLDKDHRRTQKFIKGEVKCIKSRTQRRRNLEKMVDTKFAVNITKRSIFSASGAIALLALLGASLVRIQIDICVRAEIFKKHI